MSEVERLVDTLGPSKGFTAEPVDPEALSARFHAARVAPSADNAQVWRFVVVRDPGRRKALADAVAPHRRELFASAPLLVAALGELWIIRGTRREQPFFLIDVPIAIAHIVLQAAELGLACEVDLEVDEDIVKTAVQAGPGFRAVALLALGQPLRP